MNKPKRTILLIEDAPEDRVVVRRALANEAEYDYTLLEAATGAEGLRLWREGQPDCVLLDYQLPDTDGLALLKTMVAEYESFTCPVVMLTGLAAPELAVAALKSGAQDFIIKHRTPPEKLCHTISSAIEKVAAQLELAAQRQLLAESEAKFSAAFHNSSAFMSIVSEAEVKYIDVNQSSCELFGVKREDVIGHSPAEFDFYADPAQRVMLRGLLNRNGYVHDFEVQWKLKTGEVCTHLLNADRIMLNGQPCLFVVSNDITERQQAEEKLRASEERLRVATDAAEIYAWEVEVNTRAIKYADNHARVLGFALPLDFAAMQEIIHPDDRAESLATFENALATGQDFESEIRLINPSTGAIVWVCTNAVILKDSAGNSSRVFGVVQNITRRKLTEEKLKESEDRFQLAFAAVQAVIYDWNIPADQITRSAELVNLLGFDNGEPGVAQNKWWLTRLHPADAQRASKVVRDAIESGADRFEDEYRVQHKDGHYVWVRDSGAFLKDEAGQPVRCVGSIRNIEERKQVQHELQVSEERLKLAVTGAHIGTFDWNIKTGEITWSSQTEESAAMAASDFNNSFEGFTKLIHPLDREMVEGCIASALKDGDYECEFRMLRGDGTFRWVIGKGRVFFDNDGTPARLVGVDINITKRKLAEEQLRENQLFTQSIVETAPTVLYTFDLQTGSPTYLTNQAATVLGYSFDEVKDRQADFLQTFMHPDDAKLAQEHFQQISQANNGEVFEFEYRMQHKSGEWRWFRSRDKVFKRDENGRSAEILGIASDITERKQAHEELRASEERFRRVLAQSNAGIVQTDATGRMILVNQRWCQMLGYSEAELLSMNVVDVTHSSSLQITLDSVGKLAAGGPDFEIEKNYQRKDGSLMPAVSNVSALRGKAGEFQGLVAVVIDITERLQRERNLGFLAALSKDFAPLSSTGEIMAMASARIAEYLNLSHCLLVEINEAKDEAAVVYDHHAADTANLVGVYRATDFHTEEELAQLIAGNAIIINDVRDEPRSPDAAAKFEALGTRALMNMPHLSGGQWQFTLSAQHSQPHQWRADETELLSDLAARLWTRLERARAEEAMRESEERFRALFDSIDEGFCIIEMIFDENDKPFDYRFVQANPALERLTGLTDVLGKTVREFIPNHEEFWFETYGQVALTGEAVRFENKSEPLNRWFDVYASRVGDESSRRVAVVLNNITERKLAEAEREQLLAVAQEARATAEAATRAKDEFVALVSHELRNPLNSILGYNRMLQQGGVNDLTRRKYTDIIETNARRQLKLLEDLLDTARMVSGKLKLDIRPCNFVRVINEALDAARPGAEAKQITLATDLLREAEVQLTGDPDRLQQVVWNLLTNAIKFTPTGGAVIVALAPQPGGVQLTITDTGKGIAAEVLPAIFDRFSQADASSSRRQGGLGLGLALVKQLVEMHGGTIAVASDGVGQGATFTITLPWRAAPQPSEAVVPMTEALSTSARLAGVHILVVDDEADAREVVTAILTMSGAQVTAVASADAALALLTEATEGAPAVLVSDIGMPEIDGYALLRRVRLAGLTLPAVAVTAFGRMEDRVRALAAGFQMHVPKPVEPEELVAVICSLMNR